MGRPLQMVIGVIAGLLLAGCIYWAHSVAVLKFGLYGTPAKNGSAIPSLLALLSD